LNSFSQFTATGYSITIIYQNIWNARKYLKKSAVSETIDYSCTASGLWALESSRAFFRPDTYVPHVGWLILAGTIRYRRHAVLTVSIIRQLISPSFILCEFQ
jgi:hypothetical protein